MPFLLTFAITAICTIVFYHILRNKRYQSKVRQLGCDSARTYPQSDSILGIDLFLRTGKAIQGNSYLLELTRRYGLLGNTFSAKSLGTSSINSIEPENLKAVFSSKVQDWGVAPLRYPAGKPFCGKGFITTDGNAWEHYRALLRPSFHRETAVNLPTLEKHLSKVIGKIPKDGSTFDLQFLLFALYLDTSTLFLFGESTDSLSGETTPELQAFLEAFDHTMQGVGIQIALGPFKILYRLMDPKWWESCKVTHRFADKYVRKALQHRQKIGEGVSINEKEDEVTRKPYVLLSGLAEQTDDPFELRNGMLQALMATQETTAALISNVFVLLSRNQSAWQQLREEVIALGGQTLNADVLLGMRYLRDVLNETLRLHPVFPQMNRVALVDTVLPIGGGPDGTKPIFAPAGTVFDTSFYNLHRLKSIWGNDADDFKPDRWVTFKPDTWQYLPFGGGPRSCLGRTKALVEASYVIVRLLQEFSGIESRDDRPWTGKVQLTTKNANGCWIAFSDA